MKSVDAEDFFPHHKIHMTTRNIVISMITCKSGGKIFTYENQKEKGRKNLFYANEIIISI